MLEGWNGLLTLKDDFELPRFFWGYVAGLLVLVALLVAWWRFW